MPYFDIGDMIPVERNLLVIMPFYSKEEFRTFASDIRLLLTSSADEMTDEIALGEIEDYVFSLSKAGMCDYKVNAALINRLFLSLRKEMDILQPYVDDRSVSEIMVNGRDNIFVEYKGNIEKVPLAFDSTEDLEELIRRIAAGVHREINELNPIVDARLSDGSRVNAVYGNIALNGPNTDNTKFPEEVMTANDLIRNGTVTYEAARPFAASGTVRI